MAVDSGEAEDFEWPQKQQQQGELESEEGSMQELSLEEFQRREAEDFASMSLRLDQSVKEYVEAKLRVVGYPEDEVDGLAEEILHDGVEIHENAEVDSEDLDEMNVAAERYATLYERALLLLVGPRSSGENRKMTLEEDRVARRMQYEHFCDIYPGIKENPDSNPALEPENIYTYQEMLDRTREYFSEYGSKSRKAIIVFNGHGNSCGITLELASKPIPIDTFLADVRQILRDCSSFWGGVKLPQALDVILAECYSHCFNSPTKQDIMQVIPLTTEANPKSRFKVTWKRQPNKVKEVKDARHEQLNAQARLARQEAEAAAAAAADQEKKDDEDLDSVPQFSLDATSDIEDISSQIESLHMDS